ncbi:hypothetical protein [Rubrivivax gelatinosus]|nr:hypothetical protein [Rubrivivax gelatinosus]
MKDSIVARAAAFGLAAMMTLGVLQSVDFLASPQANAAAPVMAAASQPAA